MQLRINFVIYVCDFDKTTTLNCKHILKQAEITRYINGILCSQTHMQNVITAFSNTVPKMKIKKMHYKA